LGLRNLVNFGHTIGHAIEAVLMPGMLHGECISVGMILEAEVARQLGHLGQVGTGRLTHCLKSYNLPISLSDPRITGLPASRLLTVGRLLDIMRIDKKNSGPEKKIVLLATIGKTVEQKASVIPDPAIGKALAEAAKVVPGVPTKSPVRMATPGLKSIPNRALVLAALGSGTCRLRNLLHFDDTQVMMTALHKLPLHYNNLFEKASWWDTRRIIPRPWPQSPFLRHPPLPRRSQPRVVQPLLLPGRRRYLRGSLQPLPRSPLSNSISPLLRGSSLLFRTLSRLSTSTAVWISKQSHCTPAMPSITQRLVQMDNLARRVHVSYFFSP
jgi:hypothetical protein